MKRVLLPLLAICGIAVASAAHPVPQLVKDINTRPATDAAKVQFPTAMEKTLFFTACDAAHGQELWISDGTPKVTKLLKDVLPGFGSSFPRELTVVGNTLYFVADDFQHGFQLWKSDGTPDGTCLVKDLAGDTSSLAPKSLTSAGNKLFFLLPAEDGLDRLWTSDGTEGGTMEVAVADPYEGSPSDLIACGNTVVFARGDSLYSNDGTPTGTISLGSITRSFIFSGEAVWEPRHPFISFGHTVIFMRGDSMYRSDGTLQGTFSLGQVNPSLQEVRCFVGDDILYFTTGWWFQKALWKADGSPGGAAFIANLGSEIDEGMVLGNTLVYSVGNWRGPQIWSCDGTAAGNRLLKRLETSYTLNFRRAGGFVYFATEQTALWRTNGTEIGTSLVIDLPEEDFSATSSLEIFSIGDQVYFLNGEKALWITDGTEMGSRVLKREAPTWENYISHLVSNGETLFFVASGQLWRSDGTGNGTIPLAGLSDRTADSGISKIYPARNWACFSADDGARIGLWSSRGTRASTAQIHKLIDAPIWSFYPVGDRILMVAGDDGNLWGSDGTSKGTRRLFHPTRSHIGVIGTIDDELYFTHGGVANEIWKTDGTLRGTKKVRGPNHLPLISRARSTRGAAWPFDRWFQPTPLTSTAKPATEKTLFFLEDGKLYRTDGTADSTYVVDETYFGFAWTPMVRMGSQVYFMTHDFWGADYPGLWCSDGTPEGTRCLLNSWDSAKSSYPVVLKDKVFFMAASEQGDGLWSTDGTWEGTQLVAPTQDYPLITPVAAGDFLYFADRDEAYRMRLWRLDSVHGDISVVGEASLPQNPYNSQPVAVGSVVYFSGSTEMEGNELWRTDGTAAGTYMVADLTEDSASSDPGGFGLLGSQLLFWATTSARGRELYSLDVSADLAPPP